MGYVGITAVVSAEFGSTTVGSVGVTSAAFTEIGSTTEGLLVESSHCDDDDDDATNAKAGPMSSRPDCSLSTAAYSQHGKTR